MSIRAYLVGALAAFAQMTAADDDFDVHTVRCGADPKTLIPTPTFGNGSVLFLPIFTVCSETVIPAGISDVYNALLDFRSYSKWNSFCVNVSPPAEVQGPSQVTVGMPITITSSGLLPVINSTTNEKIFVLEAPSSVRTGSAVVSWGPNLPGLKSEHPSVLTDQGDGTTLYVSYETYYGATAVVSGVLQPALQKGFTQQGADLAKYLGGK